MQPFLFFAFHFLLLHRMEQRSKWRGHYGSCRSKINIWKKLCKDCPNKRFNRFLKQHSYDYSLFSHDTLRLARI